MQGLQPYCVKGLNHQVVQVLKKGVKGLKLPGVQQLNLLGDMQVAPSWYIFRS